MVRPSKQICWVQSLNPSLVLDLGLHLFGFENWAPYLGLKPLFGLPWGFKPQTLI